MSDIKVISGGRSEKVKIQELRNVIEDALYDYCLEHKVTGAVVVGVLEILKHDIIANMEQVVEGGDGHGS